MHDARVLRSFPADTPAPKFVGPFSGVGGFMELELHLWRDSRGIFGRLLYPVLDVDSPSGRLRDVQFDEKTERLTFAARYERWDCAFVGRLQGNAISGTFTVGKRPYDAVLRKLPPDEAPACRATTDSRAGHSSSAS
jgi:hypothetical protein